MKQHKFRVRDPKVSSTMVGSDLNRVANNLPETRLKPYSQTLGLAGRLARDKAAALPANIRPALKNLPIKLN